MSTAEHGSVPQPKAKGNHNFPAAQCRHSQRQGPNHDHTSRPSGHQSPCWDLSPSVLANCGSPESYSLVPPHAVLSRTVPTLLQVGTVSASLCHPYLCLFRTLTHAQLLTSVLLELLEGEISRDGEMPDLPDHICASWVTAQHPRAHQPIPGTLGTTSWAVRDAGSSPCPAWGSEAGFPHSACPACLSPGWKSQPLQQSA